jgi:type VI secretion system protein ImpK
MHRDKNHTEDIAYDDPVQLMSQFYQQMVDIKRCIQRGDLSEQVAQQLALSRAPTQEEIAEAVSLRLRRWVEKTRLTASKLLTQRECSRIDEALYVMTALADELFILVLDWPGRGHWEHVLLEENVFGSSYAGEQFFRGAIRLLEERTLDLQQQKLVSVYLLALHLGFRGRLRDDPEKLDYLRQQLFKRISVTAREGSEQISPQPYRHVLTSSLEQRLAPQARWTRLMVLGAMAYLGIGWVLWLLLEVKVNAS